MSVCAVLFFIFINITFLSSNDGAKSSFTVDIAIPGYFGFDSVSSLFHIGPAFDSGMLYLRNSYPNINWTSTYLTADGKTCADVVTYVQDLVAEWYYRKKYGTSDLQLIVTGGNYDTFIILLVSVNRRFSKRVLVSVYD